MICLLKEQLVVLGGVILKWKSLREQLVKKMVVVGRGGGGGIVFFFLHRKSILSCFGPQHSKKWWWCVFKRHVQHTGRVMIWQNAKAIIS